MSDNKVCARCLELKPLTEYYMKGKFRICIACVKIEDKEKELRNKIETGGGIAIRSKPNTYTNDIQKQVVFEIMDRLGWTFNIERELWYKLPIKDENGQFLNLKKKKRVFVNNQKDAFYKKPLTEEKIKIINQIGELREKGYTLDKISKIVNYSKPTIRKNLKLFYERRAH